MAIFEKHESRSERIAAQGITAQRVFISDWATRHANAPKIGDPYPDLLGVYCQDVQIVPYTWADGDPSLGPVKAKIVANYSSADSAQQQDEDYEAESIDFGGEMLAKGGGRWEGVEASARGGAAGEKQGKPVEENDPGAVTYYPRAEYIKEMVIDDITGWAKKIYKATGKLNSSSFMGGKAETWLFQGADAVKFVDQDGKANWRMTFRFVYRDTGWNKSWRKDDPDVGGKWDKIIFTGEDGEIHYLYETTSFNTLLQK